MLTLSCIVSIRLFHGPAGIPFLPIPLYFHACDHEATVHIPVFVAVINFLLSCHVVSLIEKGVTAIFIIYWISKYLFWPDSSFWQYTGQFADHVPFVESGVKNTDCLLCRRNTHSQN